MAGGHYQLNNLTCILDKNGLQMTGTTEHVMNIDPVADKVRAFGWDVIEIEDGNDMAQVCAALACNCPSMSPTGHWPGGMASTRRAKASTNSPVRASARAATSTVKRPIALSFLY